MSARTTYIPVPDWALRLEALSPGELLVVGAIAAEYRGRSYALVGMRSLGQRLGGRDRNQVRAWFRALVARGLVSVDGTERSYQRVRLCPPAHARGNPPPGVPTSPGEAEWYSATPHKKEGGEAEGAGRSPPPDPGDGTW